jgi:hypothetical protein
MASLVSAVGASVAAARSPVTTGRPTDEALAKEIRVRGAMVVI